MTIRQIMTRLLGSVAGLFVCAFVMGQASWSSSVPLRGNHPAEVAALKGAVRANSTMPLQLTIVLGVRNQAALDQLLADQQNPASPQDRKWLTPQQFSSRFGPTDKQGKLLIECLRGEGFEVTSVNRIGGMIQARADAQTAEPAFSTPLMSAGASFA